MRPYMTPLGKYLASLYPLPNYNDPNNLYNYVYSRARADRTATTSRCAFDWNISNNTKAYVRVAREAETRREPARRVVGARRTSRCRRRTSAPTARPVRTPATSSRC